MWFTKQGKRRSMEVSPNPWCLGWIPGSGKSLFRTSVGNEANRYQLIDWDLGKRLWDIPSPGDGRVLAMGLSRNSARGRIGPIRLTGRIRGCRPPKLPFAVLERPIPGS